MKKTHLMKFVLVLVISGLMSVSAIAKEVQNNFFVDLLILQEGKTKADAERYFSKVVPIVARHGLVRVHRFNVSTVFSGDARPKLMNLWTMAHANVFTDINNDPQYKKLIPTRNKIFDMENSHMYIIDQP